MDDSNVTEKCSSEVLFDEIPIILLKDNTIQPNIIKTRSDSIMSQSLKKRALKLLKPCYYQVKRINPSLANQVKNYGFGMVHNLRSKANKTGKDKLVGEKKSVDILIDSTQLSRTVLTTGIQRVVKKLISNFPENVVIGRLYGGYIITNNAILARLKNIKTQQDECRINQNGIKKLVLLDSSWEYKEAFENCIEKIHKTGGECYSVIYDLIPVRHPEVVDSEEFAKIFIDWHNMVLQKADHIMCISKSVADDVIAYYNERKFTRKRPLAVSYFPLGADLCDIREINPKFVRKCLQRFFNNPTFLMVGTIEPRKGHMVALEAFTKLLNKGYDINLLIIGRNGWKNDEIIDYISRNKYYKKNILWIQDASDYELRWSYQHASCLISASLEEGYGLPIIEGAQYGIPIICSDIPVFREVSQGYADFFKTFDIDSLVNCIERWLSTDKHPDSSKIRIYTWKEATDIFMEIIEGKRKPYEIIT